MDDALKISLGAASGAIGGFIVGVLTEPIKLSFQKRSKLRQMETALYREMGSNLQSLIEYLRQQSMLKEGHHIYVHDISKKEEVLQQTKQDYLYAQLPDLNQIEIFYRMFASFKGKGETPEHWAHARNILNLIKQNLKTKKLNKNRLTSHMHPTNIQVLEDL